MSVAVIVSGALAIGGALGVILARAPVHSVIALIVNFLGLAGVYLSLQAEFLAVAQVIVYAGAVMILFLFVIALLTVKREPMERLTARSAGRRPLNLLAAFAIAFLVVLAIVRSDPGGSVAVPSNFGTVRAMGETLLVTHVFPFEIAALVLLVAVVGVVVLVGRRPEKGRE